MENDFRAWAAAKGITSRAGIGPKKKSQDADEKELDKKKGKDDDDSDADYQGLSYEQIYGKFISKRYSDK
eukprot:4943404-Pyramimonas_sp.AAC.1